MELLDIGSLVIALVNRVSDAAAACVRACRRWIARRRRRCELPRAIVVSR